MNWKIVVIVFLVFGLTACGGIEDGDGPVGQPTPSQLSNARADSYEVTLYSELNQMVRLLDKEACVLVYDSYGAVAVIPVPSDSPLFLDCY